MVTRFRLIGIGLASFGVAFALLVAIQHLVAGPTDYYVSVGDSYAVGYQPDLGGSTFGYTGYVSQATGLKLENFGCVGATAASILTQHGCTSPATDGVSYSGVAQAVAAAQFIRSHRSHVRLITVSIGGDDLIVCASTPDPASCIEEITPKVAAHVKSLARLLRTAAGQEVPIIGLTYPDVLLGAWVYPPAHPDKELARLSVSAFESVINPALKNAYTSETVSFLDITEASGAYQPLSNDVVVRPYGRIPAAVGDICGLTWACSREDIHPTTRGYQFIARLIYDGYRARAAHAER